MKIQTVKHSVSKVAGLIAIALTTALFSLPALAGIGEAVNRMNQKPQSSSKETPTAPASTTTEPTAPAPMTTEPAAPTPTTQEPQSKPQAAASGTIVDVASSNSSFKTLTAALKAAGLTQQLSGKGPYTVFAPTDAAFAALPEGTVEKLLKPENKEVLKKILSYHVVSGKVESTDLKTGQVQTVEGAPVEVSVSGSSVMVNDAKVTTPDIKATNGVIHVIDKVILPPGI
ncbi:fasciclin domain-containing protein [Leptothermofonsia sp. ETS-13]|uniref:fasciclin domain-containing protein n=1 Tax=Leptothermofonsia sp. ETS-13 TaxID=3035696 RepID=UPI003BA2025A